MLDGQLDGQPDGQPDGINMSPLSSSKLGGPQDGRRLPPPG